jgi:hypothetical protein
MNWLEAKLTPDYLLESGLLFEVNRTYFHLFGLSLAIQDGALVLLDSRREPEKLKFDRFTMARGQERLRTFLAKFGHAQMDRRRDKLGWSVQPSVDPNKQERTRA